MKARTVRIGRALLMGLGWALAWIPLGMAVSMWINGEQEPEWIGGPLYAGLLSGVTFSALAGLASGRHRLHELSLRHAAGVGAISGALVGIVPFVLGDQHATDRPLWILPAAVIGTLTALGTLTAIMSAWMARFLERQEREIAARQ